MENEWRESQKVQVMERLGTATVEPGGSTVAGSIGEWKLTFTVGSLGVDEGGTVKLAWRFASDWEQPQFELGRERGYTTVSTTGKATIRPHFERKGHSKPWQKCILMDVVDGFLAPGDKITIILGDRRNGSPGIRAQTFQETAFQFLFFVDPTNGCLARPIAESPTLRIVAGEAARLVCIVPTQAAVGERERIFVKGEDLWGNPTSVPGLPHLRWEGTGEVVLEKDQLTFKETGTGRIRVAAGDLECMSNPITGYSAQPALERFWGDLHAQTGATVGTGTEEEFFRFGRDAARLDFIGHQGNDLQVSDADWQRLNDTVHQFHEDGRFVVFPGYEWSGNTCGGGDWNVFYCEEGLPIMRSSHWHVPHTLEDKNTPAYPADVLFERLRRNPGAEKVILCGHVGGRYADVVGFFDPDICSLVEVVSCWGIFEWLLFDALAAGHVIGVVCNSDGHKGRPGAEGSGAGEFGIANGLTCVLASALTRQAIWEALKARHCYGTTGPRIDLDFTVAGKMMGSVLATGGTLRASGLVRGTAPIESIALFRGSEAIHTVQPSQYSSCGDSRRIRLTWRGSRIRGRGRRVTWDGVIRFREAKILSAIPYQLDCAEDRITQVNDRELTFRSRTTGDADGVDLYLDREDGLLVFESPVVRREIDLGDLRGSDRVKQFHLGGVGLELRVERYPMQVDDSSLSLQYEIEPIPDRLTPFFIKVVQEDGHMAWSSPIYLDAR